MDLPHMCVLSKLFHMPKARNLQKSLNEMVAIESIQKSLEIVDQMKCCDKTLRGYLVVPPPVRHQTTGITRVIPLNQPGLPKLSGSHQMAMRALIKSLPTNY